MNLADYKKLSIDGIELKDLYINGTLAWKNGYTNQVPLSTEADGKTIYNGGLGYKDGYRIRSSGAEADATGMSVCTGFIPFVKGDKLYIYPAFTRTNVVNAINFSDKTFTNLGQVTANIGYGMCERNPSAFNTQEINDVSVLDLSNCTVSGVENIAYVRITNGLTNYSPINMQSGAEMIITKNEEIER